MRVIDIDPEVLKRSAQAAMHAANEGVIHVDAEIAGDVPAIMTTLAETGPYGYTIEPHVEPDGRVKMPILSGREEIFKAYHYVRGMCDVLTHKAVVDVRGAWYLFQEVVNTGCLKGHNDEISTNDTLILLPAKTGKGITGELFWLRVPRAQLGTGPAKPEADERTLRLEMMAMHDGYLEALRNSDAAGVAAIVNEDIQSAVRDYVNETGALTSIGSKAAFKAYWRSFFDKYEVKSVDLLHRVIQEWYLFSELRFTLRRKDGGGDVAFHTADYMIPAKDGLFIAQCGHGTDEAPVRG
jgi:hypothetical protein